jgi:adenylate kinase family enzyme
MFFLQMSGFPGSGKSTLSREIARRLDAVIVDYDVPKTALLESTSQHPLMHTLTIDMNRPLETYLPDAIAYLQAID